MSITIAEAENYLSLKKIAIGKKLRFSECGLRHYGSSGSGSRYASNTTYRSLTCQ